MRITKIGKMLGVTSLSATMMISGSLLPGFARTTKTASVFAPGAIGIIEAKGGVTINGRPANGSFTVWGDELIQADNGARIVFGALGEVKINPGATLQLKMENAKLHEAAGTQAFSAALLAGTMSVALQNNSGALVNSASSEFSAARGAIFKVDHKAGRAMLETTNGTVLANAAATARNPLESKIATSTTTKKDAQYLSAQKLEKLIGSFQLKVPATVVAEAARREKAMDELVAKKSAFMRSLSISSSSAFYGSNAGKNSQPFDRTIGAAESLRGVLINGKMTAGREMLWGGETIEAPQGSGARLSVNQLGQVLLNSGAKAKLSTETVGVHSTDTTASKVIAAQLLSGDIHMKLEKTGSGYVRAGDSVMAASRGAQFRVEMREGNGAVDVTEGSVMVIGNWPVIAPPVLKDAATGKLKLETRTLTMRPANLNSLMQVQVKQSRQLQMRVTDDKNRPVADVPVRFSLHGTGSLGANIFGMNVIEIRTDARGIAAVPYNAGTTTGEATVTAEIPGTTTTTTTTATVTTQEANFMSWQGGFPAVVVAAAAIGIGAGVWMNRKDRLPIKGVGDAVVIP